MRVERIAHLLLENNGVGILVSLAVEDEPHVDVVVPVKWQHPGVHGIAALIEALELRDIVVKVRL